MSQLKMDVQNSNIKHLPVKVNNCVKRRRKQNQQAERFFNFFEEISQENVLLEGGGVY